MEFIKKNINKIIFVTILILLLITLFLYITRERELIKTFRNDGIQTIKIYTNKNENRIYPHIKNEDDSDKIQEKLNSIGVTKFILNNNGNITAGEHYAGKKYLVSIIKDENVLDTVYLVNCSLYIAEEEDILVAAIDENMKMAKETALKSLEKKEVDSKKAVYIWKDDSVKMTEEFKKYIN